MIPENTVTADAPGVTAGRVRFVARPGIGDTVIAEFRHPTRCVAVHDCLDIETLMRATPFSADGQVDFVLLPGGAATPYALRKRVEDWIAQPIDGLNEVSVILTPLGDQVLWRPGCFVISGDPERGRETFRAIVEFAHYEAVLRRMERETEEYLQSSEQDINLTHQVGDADLARWPGVNEGVRRATLLRIRFARLEPCLERPSPRLVGATRRIVTELTSGTEVADRLEVVDGRIDILQDLYESATDRLSEYSYFRREYRLEMAIVIVLLLEIVAIVWETLAVMAAGAG